MRKLAPICLFVYNRLDHTRQTLEYLQKNSEAASSSLFVFSDGPRNESDQPKVNELRSYLKTIKGFTSIEIIERPVNMGLARSIIDGVSRVVEKYGRVIVIEDDLVTSPYFLKFMNDGLDVYQDSHDVASIHGYVYPIDNLPETFFLKGADCWGWATWKDRWSKFESDGFKLLNILEENKLKREFDFDDSYEYVQMLKDQISGKNNSWAIRWYASAFVNSMYTLYPGKSLVANIGFDDSGTHCDATDVFDVSLHLSPIKIEKKEVRVDLEARSKFVEYFTLLQGGLAKRIFRKFKKLLKKALFQN